MRPVAKGGCWLHSRTEVVEGYLDTYKRGYGRRGNRGDTFGSIRFVFILR